MDSDKQKHLIACMIITFFVGLFLGVWCGVAASVVAGVGKELYDSRQGGTGWDWEDIAWDVYGTAVGLVLLFLVKLLLGGPA